MMTLTEMAKELVEEEIRAKQITGDEMHELLSSTFAALQHLHRQEPRTQASAAAVLPQAPEETPVDWRKSITKHAITCLECGHSFRQLSSRHLRMHDLDAKSYRLKYGIPSSQHLSSRQATARRQELAQQIRPWERAAASRAAAKQPAKAKGTR